MVIGWFSPLGITIILYPSGVNGVANRKWPSQTLIWSDWQIWKFVTVLVFQLCLHTRSFSRLNSSRKRCWQRSRLFRLPCPYLRVVCEGTSRRYRGISHVPTLCTSNALFRRWCRRSRWALSAWATLSASRPVSIFSAFLFILECCIGWFQHLHCLEVNADIGSVTWIFVTFALREPSLVLVHTHLLSVNVVWMIVLSTFRL